jgi:FtsH-binding integral membrane protein
MSHQDKKYTSNEYTLNQYIGDVNFCNLIGYTITLAVGCLLSKCNMGLLFFIFYFANLIPYFGSILYIYIDFSNRVYKMLAFVIFSMSSGFVISPALKQANDISLAIIPIAIVISLLIFSIASAYAYARKNYGMIHIELPLLSFLNSIMLYASIFTIIKILHGNTSLDFIDNYLFLSSIISAISFSVLIAVDTQIIIKEYNENKCNVLGHAVRLQLDMINLLLDIIRILSKLKKNNDAHSNKK